MAVLGTDTSVQAGAMNLSLTVKLPEGLINVNKFDDLLAKYAPDIAREARDFWIAEAGRRLTSSKRQYQEAIVLQNIGTNSFTIALTDPLAVAVETGGDSFDMKPGLMGKVVPLNLDRKEVPSNPTFRTVTAKGDWTHPGWEARNLLDAVIEELTEIIIPKYVQKIIEEL